MNTPSGPPGPYDQLKRSLKRAGLMILIMIVVAAVIMGYVTYQVDQEIKADGPAVNPVNH